MRMSKAVKELLYDLWRTDKTPVYEYPGNCRTQRQIERECENRMGAVPARPGQKWWTPRERIEREYPGGLDALLAARLPRPRKEKP